MSGQYFLHKKYVFAGVFSAIFSSVAWIFEEEAVRSLSPLIVSSFASLCAACLLLPFVYHRLNRELFLKLLRIKNTFIVVVLVRNVIGFLLFLNALLYTSSVKTMFLTKMESYLLLLIHWLVFKEKVSGKEILLLLVHIMGAVLLSSGSDLSLSLEHLGDFLIILGLLASASVYYPGKKIAETLGSMESSMLTNLCSGLLLLPFALYYDFGVLSENESVYHGLYYLFLTTILYYFASTVLWFYSLKGVVHWLNSALRCLGPIFAFPLAYLLFEKTLSSAQILGATIVILTSLLLLLNSRKLKS